MAKLTLADMQTQIWADILDTDSVNRGIDSTTLTALLNRVLTSYKGWQDDRVYTVAGITSGASTSAAGVQGFQTSVANIKRILNLYPALGGADTTLGGIALSRWEPFELKRMQYEDDTQLAASDFASAYSATRRGTATAANVGKWDVSLWRLPDATTRYYVIECLQDVTALSGSTDKADITEAEDYMLCDMAASIAARRLGRPEEFIAAIDARLTPAQQNAAKALAREMGMDRDRPGEDAA